MRWYKARINHTLYNNMTETQFMGFHKIMALTAHLEKAPTEKQMLSVCHKRTLTSIETILKTDLTSLENVLKMVLTDVETVVNQRDYWKKKKRKEREKQTNVNGDINRVSNTKIRLDKIRLDNKEERATPQNNKFIKPSPEEMQAFITYNKLSVDCMQIFDHYESNGWMVGKNKMKDWQACIRNWERREKKGGNYGKVTNRTQQSIDAGKEYIAELERQEGDNNTSGEVISITEFGA